jgi:hypothetical protein
MEGIQYVTNEKGERVAVQIDLKKFGEAWEDFYDNLPLIRLLPPAS